MRKAVFMDRDGVINEEKNYICKPEELKLIPGAAKAVRKINHSEFLAIIITNQSVIARNMCSIKRLKEIHNRLKTLLDREEAKLDAIYYCPHYPEKIPGANPEFNIECDCRKPKTGLIMKAQKDFNIDLKKSFFIGDSERDILCGKNAGTKTAGVQTGYGCKNSEVKPDYFFKDLYESVNFIIQEI